MSKINILVKFSISNNRNFLFKSTKKTNFTLYRYIVDFYIIEIIIRNDSFKILIISHNFCLRFVIEMKYDDYFLINLNETHRTMTLFKSNWIKNIIATNAMFTFSVTQIEFVSTVKSFNYTSITKTTLANDIIIYDNEIKVFIYQKFVEKLSNF